MRTIIHVLLLPTAVAVLVGISSPRGERSAIATGPMEISNGDETMADSMKPGVFAQNYPTRPVRLIEPFGADGGPDLIARALGPKLSELWGQPVIVENHPGEGSTAAPALVAKSPADGCTLLVNTSAQAYSAALLKNLPYDPLKDFIPVAPLTSQPYVLVAGKSTGITTVAELIAGAKAKPGQLKFGSSGIGTGSHLGVEKFNLATGIKAVHMPARSDDSIADTIANTVSGRTDYLLAPIPLALAEIHAGRLRALGVSTGKRSSLLPDVPTLAEAGVSGFDFPIWYGVWAPAGTPAAVVEKLAKDIARVLAAPDLRDSLAKHGAEPMSMTPSEFARFVLSESESAARLIKAAGKRDVDPAEAYCAARVRTMQEGATVVDVERLGALMADDIVYEHPTAGFRVVGRAAVLSASEGHLGDTRRASSIVRRRLIAPGAAAVEEDLTFEARDNLGWTRVHRRQLLFVEHHAGRLTRVIEYWER